MAVDVLIVDDSLATRKILQRVLRQSELPFGELHEAADGVEALQLLSTKNIGLVLSDVSMPNMDGIQLLETIKRHPDWKTVPVLMISSDAGESKILEAVRRGAAGYIRKPFSSEQIKLKLATLL